MRDALSGAAPPRPVTRIVGKVGIGDEKPVHSLHDAAIIKLDRPGKPSLHFAAVVLGSFDLAKMNKVEVALYDCVASRNS
jgi:hypothetical protein